MQDLDNIDSQNYEVTNKFSLPDKVRLDTMRSSVASKANFGTNYTNDTVQTANFASKKEFNFEEESPEDKQMALEYDMIGNEDFSRDKSDSVVSRRSAVRVSVK